MEYSILLGLGWVNPTQPVYFPYRKVEMSWQVLGRVGQFSMGIWVVSRGSNTHPKPDWAVHQNLDTRPTRPSTMSSSDITLNFRFC